MCHAAIPPFGGQVPRLGQPELSEAQWQVRGLSGSESCKGNQRGAESWSEIRTTKKSLGDVIAKNKSLIKFLIIPSI